ncbi:MULTISPECIES: DUF2254 domain-containing protein [Arthrobacter]|uniref:DUF2254 domain-containing protein n=1 Tax=Arthrobacter oryzae TaxID=409290 RepID=A0A3N0BZG8_9MICC|nr:MULTISPECIES: DUF2254 domain-containing protein [Arthrobacter]QYF89239.1 DUF2254 domain-containing protein [Arthrobacter sp. PAMC25284]RNL54684.1 DUF2254 domain-containing protein [Arthrobacter oryzae]
MRGRFRVIREAFRSLLWPIPAVAVALAVVLGFWLPSLDSVYDENVPTVFRAYLFGGGPDAARAVLQAVSGSLITVTSLTFSLTVVTLQLASSQFSPRLLRTFTSDSFVHWTLALFLGTFAYSLTVLRTVRTAADQQSEFVPDIAVTMAFVFAIASVVGLVLFLAHLTREIRVETMMRKVQGETLETINVVYPEDPAGRLPEPRAPSNAVSIEAASSGFLTSVDPKILVGAAKQSRAVIRIDVDPGSSLIAGVPFATVWPDDARDHLNEEETETLTAAVHSAAGTGFERTAAQDPAFGFRQLADVAARALSPGINDPTTAVHVLAHLSSLLCFLVERDMRDRVVADDDGKARVVLALPGFASLLELSLAQARRYGLQDPEVGERIITLLQEVAWRDNGGRHREALAMQLSELRATIDAQEYTDAERDRLLTRCQDVEAALASSIPPHRRARR